MQGMMMHKPLSIIEVLRFAAEAHPGADLVSVRTEGDMHRTSYPETFGRAAQLAHALESLGDTYRRSGRNLGVERVPTF